MFQKNTNEEFSLFGITWPLFLDLALHTLTLSLNLLLVSKVSLDAVAELTVGNQVFEFCMIVFNFIGVGVCVVTAQSLGAKKLNDVTNIAHIGILSNIIIAILIGIFIFCFNEYILDLMQIGPDLRAGSQKYLLIIILALVPEALNLVLASILRGFGYTRESMLVSLAVNTITVIGNLIFLFGFLGLPKMGVAGVALSTVIGRIIGTFLLFKILSNRTKIKVKMNQMLLWNKNLVKRILGIGLPGAGENLSWHMQFMVCTSFVASLGDIYLSTHAIYFQICIFIMLFAQSLAMGTEVIIGHYVGAFKLRKVYNRLLKSLKIGFLCTIIIALGNAFVFGKPLLSLISDDKEVLEIAKNLFLLSIIMEPGRIFNIIVINSLRATGDAKFPLVMALISMWGISIPLGYFLGIYCELGLLGIWIGFCADEWFRGISMYIRWKSRIWEKKLVLTKRPNLYQLAHQKLVNGK